jgi:fatty-acyl-CoA synthase
VPLTDRLTAARALLRASIVHFERPDRLPRALAALAPWGAGLAGLAASAAARYPDRTALHDEDGSLTYAQLWQRANAQAAELIEAGIHSGQRVGILARNHIGFVEWTVATATTGADIILLNTGFAGPQLAHVVEAEGIDVVIHDDDFADVVDGCGARTISETDMAELAERAVADEARVRPHRNRGAIVILTSGTTGRPKGATRQSDIRAVEGLAALVERIPLRMGDTQVVAAPLFHAWGLTHLLLGLGRCATQVLTRRFDPETTLRAVHDHDADVLVVVPVMLARILALPPATLGKHPTPTLRVIAASGSAIGSRLTTDTLRHFGPVLYNLYGSTEVAVATIAVPDDLQREPATAGRPVIGVEVAVLDPDGNPVPDGTIGHVYVGGAMRFDGYTDGTNKEQRRGLLSTGDLGRFQDGLLFVEGRSDDMIVSGGENVYPVEVEDLIGEHAAVADVAVVGVPDEAFGQALAAFVVLRPGATLDEAGLRAYVRDHLARHKVPRQVHFLDELPRNATGKVLRAQLVTMAEGDVGEGEGEGANR